MSPAQKWDDINCSNSCGGVHVKEMKNTFSKKENLIFLRKLFYCREISRIRMWWNEVRSKSKHPPRKPEPCASDLSHVHSNSEDPRVSQWGERERSNFTSTRETRMLGIRFNPCLSIYFLQGSTHSARGSDTEKSLVSGNLDSIETRQTCRHSIKCSVRMCYIWDFEGPPRGTKGSRSLPLPNSS